MMRETLLDPGAWRGYRSAQFPACWAIEGEVLHALPTDSPVSLVSRARFSDGELALEWCLAAGGNSGILYRVLEEFEQPWHSGPEMQLLDDAGHKDGRVPETRCGALYALYPPVAAPPCPPGRFHSAKVCMKGTQVEHWLEGVRVLACDLASADFRARVARSKFRELPQFARAASGHLVLQHHGEEAWFRRARILAA